MKDLYNNNFVVVDSVQNSYSVDMIRIRTRITNEFFMQKIDSRLSLFNNVEKWESSKICDFKYNYIVHLEDNNSFWIGYISNKDLYCGDGGVNNPKHKFNLTLEFNPNKVVNCTLLNHILNLRIDNVLQMGLIWEVVSCDFAFDIKTNILNLCGFDKGRKKCLMTYDNGGEDKTYYIGKGQNRIKVYNKKIESDLNYDLTRIELSHKFSFNDISYMKNIDLKIGSCFPSLYLKEYQISLSDIELSDTFKAVLFAVNNGYPLNELSKYTRLKVKKFLQNKKPIVIDSGCFNMAFQKVIGYWFSDTFR